LIIANSGVLVLLNTTASGAATASFTTHGFNAGGAASSIALGDVNGDNKPDILTANVVGNSASVLLNTTAQGAATPSFNPVQTFAAGGSPVSAALTDLNGDGKPDILVANRDDNTVTMLLNTTTPGAAAAIFAA